MSERKLTHLQAWRVQHATAAYQLHWVLLVAHAAAELHCCCWQMVTGVNTGDEACFLYPPTAEQGGGPIRFALVVPTLSDL
jgi:hypothetical protein